MKISNSILLGHMCNMIGCYQEFMVDVRYKGSKTDDLLWKRNRKLGAYEFVPTKHIKELAQVLTTVLSYLKKKYNSDYFSFLDAGCGAGNMNIIYRMFIHDFLYVLADQLIKRYNPCQVQLSSDGLVGCVDDIEICCNGCEHLGENGCTVSALYCKLHLCKEARALKSNAHLLSKLDKAESMARRYHLLSFRSSRQETYKHLTDSNTRIRRY